MEKTAIEDVENQRNPLGVHGVRRPVSAALGTEHFAMIYFELGPGESFSGGLHRHNDQEEVFYVEAGTATFEVGRERKTVDVAAGELIRFEPGEFQVGRNEGDDQVVGWALGAPGPRHDDDELQSVVDCRECGEETVHDTRTTDEGRFELSCVECDTSFTL